MRRGVWGFFLLAAGVPLGVYVATLHPGLPAGDSGELISVALGRGVAHPPGYPLWTLLAHVWIQLCAVGDIAWRLNLFSAVTQAAAIGVLAVALTEAGVRRALTLAAVWAIALSPPLWKTALVTEVFALNGLLAAGVLWSAGRIGRGNRSALWLLVLLTTALVGHHHSLVLLVVPVWCVLSPGIWENRRQLGTPRAFAAIVAAAALGLLPLLQLAFPAAGSMQWGDTASWGGFWHHLLRRDYGTLSLDPGQLRLSADRNHALLYLADLPTTLGVLVPGLFLFGIFSRRHRTWALLVLGFVLTQGWFFSRIGFPVEPAVYRGVVERFHALPHLVLGFAGALGFEAACVRWPRLGSRPAMAVLVGLAVGIPWLAHLGTVNQRGNHMIEALSHNVLASLPQDAVLFSRGDIFHNGISVLQSVRGERPDVQAVDQELLTKPWYVRRLRADHPDLLPDFGAPDIYSGLEPTLNIHWIDHLQGRRPVAFLGVKDESYRRRYQLLATGLVHLAVDPETPFAPPAELLGRIDWRAWLRDQDPWSFEAIERERLPRAVESMALWMCQPTTTLGPDWDDALVILESRLAEHRAQGAPYGRLLRAAGMLHAYQVRTRNLALARAELEEYVRRWSADPEVSAVLAALGDQHR